MFNPKTLFKLMRAAIIIYCLLPSLVISQKQEDLDSLEKVFKLQTGDEKAITAYRIADLLLYNDLETAKNYIDWELKQLKKDLMHWFKLGHITWLRLITV